MHDSPPEHLFEQPAGRATAYNRVRALAVEIIGAGNRSGGRRPADRVGRQPRSQASTPQVGEKREVLRFPA